MHIGKFEFLWKDGDSNVVNCPSISRVTEPVPGYIVNGIPVDTGVSGTGQPVRKVARGYIVTGAAVDASTYGRIPQTGPGEWAVFVPAGVLDGGPVDAGEGGTPMAVFVPANVIDRLAVPA